jgi:excisionase family DNA binding protein
MMSQLTAEAVFQDFRKLPTSERTKFYALLGETAVRDENFSHDDVFGHLADDDFTAPDAAEYLEVSMSTFRRYVRDGKIKACSEVGRSQLFATKDLKAFKRSLREVKGG